MNSRLELFGKVRTFSSIMAAVTIVISLFTENIFGELNIAWQLVVATGALAIGIPHGALDHLVTLPRARPAKMALFIIAYLAVVVLAVALILQWNVLGFQLVLLMSLVHFGIGDCAFLAELNELSQKSPKKFAHLPVFLAFGSVPVLIPLINSQSAKTLREINPALINWYQNFETSIWISLLSLVVIATLFLIITSRYRDLLDLALLIGLATLTPPLISFAVYFGCWHAMRHTARLTLVLPKSIEFYEKAEPTKAFWSAVIPGMPALLFTFLAAIYLWQRDSLDKSFLWSTLVIVWALTVPHMMVTARLDKAALAKPDLAKRNLTSSS